MSSQGSQEEVQGRYLVAMSLTALGIVFGDIGTRVEWRDGGSGSSAACLEILFSRPPTSGFPRTELWNWGCRCSCSY